MLAYAEHEFNLNALGSDGKSLRETLETVERMKGVKPPELINPVEFPMLYAEVWHSFLRLNSKRTSNGFGANPISYLEIDAFCRLTNTYFTSEEIQVLEMLDGLVLKQLRKDK